MAVYNPQNLPKSCHSTMSQRTAQAPYRPLLNIYDLIDRVLDKGLVVDANVSVSLVGIEILVVRARIVVAGIDTFLRYAQALGLAAAAELPTPQTVTKSGA